jgi:hypothetical protein
MDTTLTGKYLRDMPAINVETDPAKLYEGQIGGYRSDVESAMTEAGQRAISTAAASGREVADVMARYLPEAVKGYGRGAADIAGSAMQQAQQGQVAKSELELKRQELSTTMEQWDKSAQIQQQQFLSQMQQDYQMHREKLANNLRIAQAQASSQRELQSIQNSYAMQMEQMKQQYAMRASQFSEAQQNARQSKLLQTYDKWKQGSYNQSQLDQIMKGIQQIQGATPPMVPGGNTQTGGTTQPTASGGSGYMDFGNQGIYRWDPATQSFRINRTVPQYGSPYYPIGEGR